MGRSELPNGGFDIPTEFTSSIGAVVWPPVETNNERLKGVYPNVIENDNNLLDFLDDFSRLEFKPPITRISGRAVVTENALMGLIQSNLPETKLIETIIPLRDCGINELSDCCLLIYVGKNQPSRQTPAEILNQQFKRVTEIFSNIENQRTQENNAPSGFVIRPITADERKNTEILNMYHQLYSLFNWSKKDVTGMLRSNNNLIVAAFNDQEMVVSSAIAEFGEMTFIRNSKPVTLSLVEITEAATLPKFRGIGLYQAVSDRILEHLAENKPPNLVFGELNLDAPGVIKVAARQGRIPAISTAEEYGLFPRGWFLEQHVVIFQGTNQQRPENYPYNNLMVAYLPRNLLLERYGRENN